MIRKEQIRRIGVLGGTFNPVHNGHLLIAEAAREYLDLERVLFIPSGMSYMKAGIPMPDNEVRLAMTRLAIAGNPFFNLSEMELRRAGNTYTCDTLEELHTEYPASEIFFIVGADTLFAIETWKAPERIFSQAIIAAAVRDQADLAVLQKKSLCLSEEYQAEIRLLPAKGMAFSSTGIRQAVAEGRSIRYMVPDAVREYIMQNQIYRKNECGK